LDDTAIADENDKIILYDNNSKVVEEGQDERSFVQELAEDMDLIGDENQAVGKENQDYVQA